MAKAGSACHDFRMRLDHVSYAAGPAGLDADAERLAEELGVRVVDGGVHPRFGTRNRLLPLADGHYVEVVAPLDHPAADKAVFGQAVKARSESGGGWLSWVVTVDDLTPVATRLGRPTVPGNRKRPDGVELRWRQVGAQGLTVDPLLPFFVQWECEPAEHPSAGGHDAELLSLDIAGDPRLVSAWLGKPADHPLEDVDVTWSPPNGRTGLRAVCFRTAHGLARI